MRNLAPFPFAKEEQITKLIRRFDWVRGVALHIGIARNFDSHPAVKQLREA